jgi:hypothetical protein
VCDRDGQPWTYIGAGQAHCRRNRAAYQAESKRHEPLVIFHEQSPRKKLHGGYFAAQLAYKQRADEAHVSCEFLERVGVIDSKGSRQREIVYDVGVAGCIVDSVPQ